MGQYATLLNAELQAYHLGQAAPADAFVECRVAGMLWAQVALELITSVLVRESAPSDTTVEEQIDGVWYRRAVFLPDRLKTAPPKYLLGLDYLKKSRAVPKTGDVFIYRAGTEKYLWGRVIKDKLSLGMGSNAVLLLYFYRNTSTSIDDRPPFDPSALVLPPVLHDNYMWRQGAFQTIGHTELSNSDILPRHCFRSLVFGQTAYFDEHGEHTPPADGCGEWGYMNPLLLDLRLCNAWDVPGRPAWTADRVPV